MMNVILGLNDISLKVQFNRNGSIKNLIKVKYDDISLEGIKFILRSSGPEKIWAAPKGEWVDMS